GRRAGDSCRARLPQRRVEGRHDADLAGLRVPEGPRPGALPGRREDARDLPGGVRRRQAPPLAPEPQPSLPGLPGGQGRLCVHSLGHAVLLGPGLAAAMLPDVGRPLCQELQGAGREDRLVPLRPGAASQVRELHGTLRIRADRGGRHGELAAGVAAGGRDDLTPARELPTVVAATRLEARAARRAVPRARVVRVGVGVSRSPGPLAGPVVSCGLAGSLRSDVPLGTVLVPACVIRPDGSESRCDAALVDALVTGARWLGVDPVQGPMLTSDRLITGAERAVW